MTIPMTIPMERVENRILSIRGHRVMTDADLAEVYGVPTKALNQAIKRNAERFPEDFAFRLTAEDKKELVTNCDRFARLKHSTVFPLAFTEHGAIWRRPFSIPLGRSKQASSSSGRSSGCARRCHRIGNSPGAWILSKRSMPRMTFESEGSSTPFVS